MEEWKKYKCAKCGYELAFSKTEEPRCSKCRSRRLIEIKQFNGVIHMSDEPAKPQPQPQPLPIKKKKTIDDEIWDDDEDDDDEDDDDEEE